MRFPESARCYGRTHRTSLRRQGNLARPADGPARSVAAVLRELFGWEFEELGLRAGTFRTVNYTLIRHNGRLIGGMVDTNRLDRDKSVNISQWVALLSVEDVDQAVESLRDAGGTVFTAPTDVAERGRIAVVADPQGALLSLLQTRDGDPADVEPAIGDFLWIPKAVVE